MSELSINSPRFSEAIIGLPYSLHARTALVIDVPPPPPELSGPQSVVHQEVLQTMMMSQRIDRSRFARGAVQEEDCNGLRQTLLAEQPRRTRYLGRSLMILHNKQRLMDDGLPISDNMPTRTLDEIAAEREEDPMSIALELRAAGFFGRQKIGHTFEPLGATSIAADAGCYLSTVTPVLPWNAELGELSRTAASKVLGINQEIVAGIVRRKRLDPVIRRLPNGQEAEFFTPSSLAVIQEAVAANVTTEKTFDPYAHGA